MAEMLAGVPASQTALRKGHLNIAEGIEESLTTWFFQSVDLNSV